MKRLLILCLFVFSCEPYEPPPVETQDVQNVEITIDRSTGEIRSVRTRQETRMKWLQLFASDRYNDKMPNKPDYIWPELANITPDIEWQNQWAGSELVFHYADTVRVDTLDIVPPFDSLNFVVDSLYFPLPKIREDTYLSALQTFTESGFFAQLPEDVIVDGQPWYNSYPFGKKEVKEYVVLRAELSSAFIDSLKYLVENGEKVKWKVYRNVLLNNIPNVTLRQANNNLDLGPKTKTWLQDNIMSLPGISLDGTTTHDLIMDKRINQRIFTHPKFIALAVQRGWIDKFVLKVKK